MTSKTWTKESLKSLARVDTTRKKEGSSNPLPDDVSKPKRKINVRAIPKTLFSTLLLGIPFGMVYLFTSGNLGSRGQTEVNAQEPEPEVKQLQRELEASRERNEELAAKLAITRQDQSHPVTEAEEIPASTPEVKRTSEPVAQPPPPRQTVSIRARETQTPPPKRIVAPPQQPTIPVEVVPSVFGGASSEDVQEGTNNSERKAEVAQVSSPHKNSVGANLSPQRGTSYEVANNFPTVNPELEASLLQEQPMVVLRTGATTKASLAVPWVQDLGGRRAESGIITVVLSEPLRGAGRRIYLPAQTTVFVKAEYLGQPDLIEFVGVEAHLPTSTDGSSRKIILPEGVIRFSAENGRPLVALPLRKKDSRGRSIFDLLDSAGQVWEVSDRITSSDDIFEGVLRGQRQVRYELGRREGERDYSDRSIVFLPEGTKLKLYVNQEVTVPSLSN